MLSWLSNSGSDFENSLCDDKSSGLKFLGIHQSLKILFEELEGVKNEQLLKESPYTLESDSLCIYSIKKNYLVYFPFLALMMELAHELNF